MGVATRKSYQQFCPLAAALDLVGDRWTILILRELLGGPARFGELRHGLPGIAPNLLAERLRRMESDGLVRHSGGGGVYALTDDGTAIRAAIEELGVWGAGMARVATPVHDRSIRAIAMALQAVLVRAGDRLPLEPAVVELDVDGEPLEIVLGPRPSVTARPATDPDARVATSAGWIAAYLIGEDAGSESLRPVSGDPSVTTCLDRALGLKP